MLILETYIKERLKGKKGIDLAILKLMNSLPKSERDKYKKLLDKKPKELDIYDVINIQIDSRFKNGLGQK